MKQNEPPTSISKRENGLLRLFGADAAQPGAVGEDGSAALTHVVFAHLALAGENAQDAHGLQAPAAAALTVFAAAAFGAFPLHVQQLHLQLSDPNRRQNALMMLEGNVNTQNCVYFAMFFSSCRQKGKQAAHSGPVSHRTRLSSACLSSSSRRSTSRISSCSNSDRKPRLMVSAAWGMVPGIKNLRRGLHTFSPCLTKLCE